VRDADAVSLLTALPCLHSLILDDCRTVHGGGEQASEEWFAFGRALALATHQRMRAREKELKQYRERLIASAGRTAAAPRAREKKAKKGRKGLATATISLRDKPGEGSGSVSQSPLSGAPEDAGEPPMPPEKLGRIRVLPPAPMLRGLAVTPSAHIPITAHAAIAEEFAQGWATGIATLSAVRARLRVSAGNGTARVMRFARQQEGMSKDEVNPLWGLVDAEECDMEELQEAATGVPVLCLAGPAHDVAHANGCPHVDGWRVFEDRL